MKKLTVATGLALAVVVVGCVTKHKIEAHIIIDIRHVEQQAEQIVDYWEGQTDTLPAVEAPAAAEAPNTSWLRRGLQALSPMQVAYAEELKVMISPRAKELTDKLRERFPKVDAMKKQGCFGESNRGYIDLRECDALNDPEAKNAAQQLLAEENNDRKELYREMARLNAADNVSLSTVERIFAMEKLERAKPGDQVQLPPAGADFDKFKASPMGQKLGAEAQAGAWVTLK